MNSNSGLRLISRTDELQKMRQFYRGRVGFVPTMGALHEGHAELLRRSRRENDLSILSIFVNPHQFNSAEDFTKYPKSLEEDLRIAGECQVDWVFLPEVQDIYPTDSPFLISESSISKLMEGKHRPGHFEGMLGIVLRLLNLAQAHKAYFGEKDFQQLRLIEEMVKNFFIQTQVVRVPCVREKSGLALSSRNRRLSATGLEMAPKIFSAISKAETCERARQELEELGMEVDYVEEHWERRFVAAKLEGVRLIDNVPKPKKPWRIL